MSSYGQILMCFIFIPLHVGYTMRSACSDDLRTCAVIKRIRGDFETAQKDCIAKGGNLITSQSEYFYEVLAALLNNTFGDFWIGKIGEGNCSTHSTNVHGNSRVTFKRDDEAFCSPKCKSVSNKKLYHERPCDEIIDGFLCDNVRWDSWPLDTTSKVIIVSHSGQDCGLHPCENKCEVIHSGYMCSCLNDFRPSRKDPRHCEFYCTSHTCLPKCYNAACDCPDGFVKDEGNCSDIDECKSNHNCAQMCVNTIGSYTCSCDESSLLVNESMCIPIIANSPNEGAESSLSSPVFSATSGEYAGLAVFLVVALIFLVVLIYYLRKRKNKTESDGIVNDANA